MATTPNMFDGLFDKLIGTGTYDTTDETLDVNNLIKQLVSGSNTQQTTGSTNQTTNQTQTGSNVSTTSTTADLARLKQVFDQQQAGVTPDTLRAIFTEGSKAIPGLTAATANAVGARSSGNSALATSLTDLNSNLVNQVAMQNQSMLKDSGNTAAQIAELSKAMSTTGTTNQGTFGNVLANSNQAQTGTNTQSTDTNQKQGTERNLDTKRLTTINPKSTAMTGGAALLASLLGGGQQGGGSNLGGLMQGGGRLLDYFKGMFSEGDGINGGSYVPTSNDLSSIFGPDGYGSTYTPEFNLGDNTDFSGTFGDFDFGWADGGLVEIPKLMLSNQNSKKKSDVDLEALLSNMVSGSKPEAEVAEQLTSTPANASAPDDLNLWYNPRVVQELQKNTKPDSDGRRGLSEEDWVKALNPLSGVKRETASYTQPAGVYMTGSGESMGETHLEEIFQAGQYKLANGAWGTGVAAPAGQDPNGEYFTAAASGGYEDPTMGKRDRLTPTYKFNEDGTATPVGAGKQYKPSGWVDSGRDVAKLVGMAAGAYIGAPYLAGAGGAGAGAAITASTTEAALIAAGKAAAINGGLTAVQGGDFGDILKGALMGGVTGGLGYGVSAFNPGSFVTSNPYFSNLINSGVKGGLGSAVRGGNVGEGAKRGAITGALKGWKDGGILPMQKGDPKGIKDTIMTKVGSKVLPALSGGETILPKDTTDLLEQLYPGMLENIIDMTHTPAKDQ